MLLVKAGQWKSATAGNFGKIWAQQKFGKISGPGQRLGTHGTTYTIHAEQKITLKRLDTCSRFGTSPTEFKSDPKPLLMV